MFRGVIANYIENQTKTCLHCFTHKYFTMIISPKHSFFMLHFFAKFIGYISIFFCDCTILFVRMIIILNRKNNTQVLLVYFPCKKRVIMCMLSLGTPTEAQE